MFTELIDTLRCPNAHADSWLVATSARTDGRQIMEGKLGCPVCRTTFEIVDGEVLFSTTPVAAAIPTFDDDAAFRLAAQLHLIEAPQPVLLVGAWSAAGQALRRILPHVKLLLGDAAPQRASDDRISALRLPERGIPLATGALRALALDSTHTSPAHLTHAARVVRTTGRIVAPASTVLDASLWRTLASDTDVIVAERLAASSAFVQLKRAPSKPLFTP